MINDPQKFLDDFRQQQGLTTEQLNDLVWCYCRTLGLSLVSEDYWEPDDSLGVN